MNKFMNGAQLVSIKEELDEKGSENHDSSVNNSQATSVASALPS